MTVKDAWYFYFNVCRNHRDQIDDYGMYYRTNEADEALACLKKHFDEVNDDR